MPPERMRPAAKPTGADAGKDRNPTTRGRGAPHGMVNDGRCGRAPMTTKAQSAGELPATKAVGRGHVSARWGKGVKGGMGVLGAFPRARSVSRRARAL